MAGKIEAGVDLLRFIDCSSRCDVNGGGVMRIWFAILVLLSCGRVVALDFDMAVLVPFEVRYLRLLEDPDVLSNLDLSGDQAAALRKVCGDFRERKLSAVVKLADKSRQADSPLGGRSALAEVMQDNEIVNDLKRVLDSKQMTTFAAFYLRSRCIDDPAGLLLIPEMTKKLNIDADQRKMLESMRVELRISLNTLAAKARKRIAGGGASVQVSIDEVQKVMAKMSEEQSAQRTQFRVKVLGLLRPEQRALVDEFWAK